MHVFEAAEIQIRQQILNPCLLLASGLRDYEIRLDRRISAARESLQLFLFANYSLGSWLKMPADFSENPAENRLGGKSREIGLNSKLVAALNLPTNGTSNLPSIQIVPGSNSEKNIAVTSASVT
jgi:hypothetical protein